MTKTLKFVFALPNDKTFSMSLAAPKDDLTRAAATDAAADAISKEAFTVGGAHPTALKDVYVYGTERIELV